MDHKSDLLDKTSKFVFELYKEKLSPGYIYHNYNHTHETVQSAEEIGKACDLPKKDMEDLLIAAWLHDIGVIHGYENHEAKSVKIATDFLQKNAVDEKRIDRINRAIMSTQYPHSPENLMEEILCDADLVHLGKKSYRDKSDLLRAEREYILGEPMSEDDWLEYEINFLTNHVYHTRYANEEYAGRKLKNIAELKGILEKGSRKNLIDEEKIKIKKRELKFKKDKFATPERGIETMFRVALRNHIDLSSIADSKANLMLSVNAIIISIVISALIPKLAITTFLTIPTFFLLLVCIISMIFATLSTRPKITEGKFTKEDVQNKKANLLFFGNFFRMDVSEFEWGMKEMMKDKDYLYTSMIRDFYYLGIVLGKKYIYLRWCYSIFMFGLITAVVLFGIAYAMADFPPVDE